MVGIGVRIAMMTSLLIPQVQSAIQFIETVPPHTSQSSITCHDATWQQENTRLVSGLPIQRKLAPFIEKAQHDAAIDQLSLGIRSAYRSCDTQMQLRVAACGTGEYNVTQKPFDQCTPPTEPAGHSTHNAGLAVDFSCGGYSLFETSPCYAWLKLHAHKYFLKEHALEPWHWSTTGK